MFRNSGRENINDNNNKQSQVAAQFILPNSNY